ncbi:LOW QUALITY PROTEIN: hypothetical protein CRUP_027537 [Coryphaenoides rupestris]|nr:LOW QUALITY PROTEIN: hypothetical protein CRUP_027537 [Coryphaenoides rupestris]
MFARPARASGEEYHNEPLESKVQVLQFLTCSAVYHLECVKPPLLEVPEDEWQCEVCVAHKVPGVVDCVPEAQRNRPYIRQLPIGFDRHRRKYWFLNRRIVVQLAELIDSLDKQYWEADLYATLEEMREEIHAHMDITEDLTNKARGSNKCFLTAANEEIVDRLRAKQEEELEELKKRSAEEAQKARLEQEKEDVDVEESEEQAKGEGPQEAEVKCQQQQQETQEENEVTPENEVPVTADNTASDSVPPPGEEGVPSLSQLPQASEDNNNNSSSSSSTGPQAPTVGPEPPDLADKSSQSSLASMDDTGDHKEQANGEGAGSGAKRSAATRMVTRLRNPDSKLSLLKNQQVAAAVHQTNQGFREGKEVLVVNAQGDVTRVSTRTSKDVVMKGALGNFFKLGQEGKYRDHDKRRHLSHKFCMTPAGDFKWNGSIHGSKVLTISTLRLTIIQLENNVPAPFMHPNWASHRTNWIKAVWKQKGEEYRVTGYGGWSWISKTHMQRFFPKLPGNTNPNYRQELEDAKLGKKCTLLDLSRRSVTGTQDEPRGAPATGTEEPLVSSSTPGAPTEHTPQEEKEKTEEGKEEELGKEVEEKMEVDAGHKGPDTGTSLPYVEVRTKQELAEESERPFNYDVVDVSKGFLTRVAYKKLKASKLDGLLERRVKQHALEEKQRQQAPASKPPTAAQPLATPARAPGTPVRPRSPLKPLTLALAQVHAHGCSQVRGVALFSRDSWVGEGAPFRELTGLDSTSLENQKQEMGTQPRTTGPIAAISSSAGQEAPSLSQEPVASAIPPTHSASVQQTACVLADIGKPQSTDNCGPEVSVPESGHGTTAAQSSLDRGDFQRATSSEPKNLESPQSIEERCKKEHQQNIQQVAPGRPEDASPAPSQPLPVPLQMNGTDSMETETEASKSAPPASHIAVANSNCIKVCSNSVDRLGEGERCAAVLPKDKPLVNGDMVSLNVKSGAVRIAEPDPTAPGRKETSGKVIVYDQDLQPPVKIARLENSVAAGNPHNSSSTEGQQKVKVIRMPPSPIPSAEESSLSDGFAEEGAASEPQTTVTQVTTTTMTSSITTTTVSTVTKSDRALVSVAPKVSSCESSAVATLTTMTKTTVTKVHSPSLDSQSEDSQSETLTQEQRTSLSATYSMSNGDCKTTELSQMFSTRGRVRLLKFSRTKKARSDTALPSYRKFVTKSNRKSIFVLPSDDLKVLARRGGLREVSIFSYNAKPAQDIWPYPSPRPTFGITWRYRLQTVRSLAGVSLMLRLLWACLRWDDMAVKPSSAVGTTRTALSPLIATETSETEITTTEIIKRRDVGPYGIRSEYCIQTHTPQRKGLRSSALRPKKPEPAKQTGPIVIESWVAEEELDLWEIRAFSERVEKEKAQAAENAKKRQEQKSGSVAVATPSPSTPASTPKVMVGSLAGQVTPGTKVVLTTKMGAPVTFQQNKNFQQSFATWVKQGQTTQGTVGNMATSGGQTFQITGTSVGGKVLTAKLPLPANSKIVAVNVPTTQGGVMQQKVLGIIPSSTPGGAQTYTTFQPRTATLNIRPNTPGSPQQVLTAGGQIRPGMTVIRTPVQQAGALGKTILRTPLVVQQGQGGQQLVTQIIRGQAVTTTVAGASPGTTVMGQRLASPAAPGQTAAGTPRPQQGQFKLTLTQLSQLAQVSVSIN